MKKPLLYSFRRCPYAIRARMALRYAQIDFDIIEVSLRDKPAEMLAISPKGTVPVLQLPEGRVIDESLDIMYWALSQKDPDNWLPVNLKQAIHELIKTNDTIFKKDLDHYKYADRFPEYSQAEYLKQCEAFLIPLENSLKTKKGLLSPQMTLADIAVFPFIRQFANVDREVMERFPHLNPWLETIEQSDLFLAVIAN